MRSSIARRILLSGTALVFIAIAIGSLVVPHQMAEGLGYTLDNVDALNEFRAIYVGMWLAVVALLVIAARRVHESILGDLAAFLILGQTAGRILSIFLDGLPTARIWPIFILEAVGGIALLIVRPSDAPLHKNRGRS